MKKRTLLGQILTVVVYLYNIAAVGLVVVMIAGLIGSNYVADKYGDTVPSIAGVNPLGTILSFLFVGVVWFVFYFILKNIRDEAGFIDKESDKEADKEADKGSLIEYFSKRKKNTVLFIILGLLNKVLIHFLFYTMSFQREIISGDWIGKSEGRRFGGRYTKRPTYEWNDNDFGEHISVIFEAELILFVPAFLSLGFIVWYFNDKIKAK